MEIPAVYGLFCYFNFASVRELLQSAGVRGGKVYMEFRQLDALRALVSTILCPGPGGQLDGGNSKAAEPESAIEACDGSADEALLQDVRLRSCYSARSPGMALFGRRCPPGLAGPMIHLDG